MEPTNTTLKQKLMNAFTNIKALMQSDKRIFFGVIGIGVLVIIFSFFVVTSLFRSSQIDESLVTEQSPLPDSSTQKKNAEIKKKTVTDATLSLVLKDPNKKTYRVGETIGLYIVGNTQGKAIRGYDAVFKFEPSKVSFGTQKDLFPSFQYMRRTRGNWILVTGTQPLDSKKTISLQNTKLMELTFTAKSAGTASFPMSYIPNSYGDSNFIDAQSNDILSNATGIVVRIRE